MIKDPECTILLGLSGAMIPGGMQKCLIELVERHYVDVIVSTGANIFHDACEHLGVRHYMGHHHVDDGQLFPGGSTGYMIFLPTRNNFGRLTGRLQILQAISHRFMALQRNSSGCMENT